MMPESPEVRVIANVIQKSIGRIFNNALIIENVPGIEHRFKRNGIDHWEDLQPGGKQDFCIYEVKTYGKLIVIGIQTPHDSLIALNTLGMTGTWRFNAKELKHTRLCFEFKDGGNLCFIDQRCLGWFKLVNYDQAEEHISKIGWDLLKAPAPDDLWMSFQHHKKIAKNQLGEALMTQSLFSGIGNLYKNESMYACGLHPQRIVSELKPEEWLSINYTAHKILKRAYELGGSSIVDFEADGVKGNAQSEHKIYGKAECPKGHEVLRITQKGRTTHYCSVCQT